MHTPAMHPPSLQPCYIVMETQRSSRDHTISHAHNYRYIVKQTTHVHVVMIQNTQSGVSDANFCLDSSSSLHVA